MQLHNAKCNNFIYNVKFINNYSQGFHHIKQHLLEQQLNQQHLSFKHQNLSYHRNGSKLQEFAKQQVCTALTRNGELLYSQWRAHQGNSQLRTTLLAVASSDTRSSEREHLLAVASLITRNGER
jgi:hypothetical protein